MFVGDITRIFWGINGHIFISQLIRERNKQKD